MIRATRLTLVSLAALSLTVIIPMVPGMTVASTSTSGADDLERCYFLRNGGACVTCCKDAGFPGNFCGHFCNKVPPPPPPDEPQP